jgi:hypothetical protein
MKMEIISARVDEKHDPPLWLIMIKQTVQEGDELGTYRAQVDGAGPWVEMPEYVGFERENLFGIPYYAALARAAEYGIDPDDINTLMDVLVCEPYIPRGWWEGPDNLWAAGSIQEAREKYLAEIARVKFKHRLSTRRTAEAAAGNAPEHPLDGLRRGYTWKPADVALRSMGVILFRHRKEAQVLDPDVAKSLVYMEKALAALPETDNFVSTEGFSTR